MSHKYTEKVIWCLDAVEGGATKVGKIGKSNSKKNFRGKGKGVIPGISSSCFVLLFHSNAEVVVAYHAWVLSAARDGKGLPEDSHKQSLSPNTGGKAASIHAKYTVCEDEDCFIWSRHADD